MMLPEYVCAVYSGGNGVTDELSLVSLPGTILIGFTTGMLSNLEYLWTGEFNPLSTTLPGQRILYHRYDRVLCLAEPDLDDPGPNGVRAETS